MEPEGIMLSEIVNQRKTKPYGFTHMWNLRNKTKKKETNRKPDS